MTSIAPLRDLAPGSVPQLSATLEAWEERSDDVLEEIEMRIEAVRHAAKERSLNEKRRENIFEAEIAKVEDKDAGGGGKGGKRAASTVLEGGGAGDDHGDMMEVEESRGMAGRGTKRLGRMLGLGALRG